MTEESDFEIKRWKRRIEKDPQRGKEDLIRYLCSISIGREFNQSADDHFEKRGLTEFDAWAKTVK